MEPRALAGYANLHPISLQRVNIPEIMRVKLVNERLAQAGVEADLGVSLEVVAHEAATLCRTAECWSSAPLQFTHGLSEEGFRAWVQAAALYDGSLAESHVPEVVAVAPDTPVAQMEKSASGQHRTCNAARENT